MYGARARARVITDTQGCFLMYNTGRRRRRRRRRNENSACKGNKKKEATLKFR